MNGGIASLGSDLSFGEDHPLWALHRIAERKLAPLCPIFTAMRQQWTALTRPERALKSVLLMAFFDVRDRGALCAHVAEIPAFQQFLYAGPPLDAEPATGPLEPVDLSQALDRLLANGTARQFVRDVLAAASASGLCADTRFTVNDRVVDEWTSAAPAMG